MRRKNGFTLIELMVVLALIGIMTAMILPEMRGTYADALLRSSSRELVDVCTIAYSRAVSMNEPLWVRFERSGGRYVIERRAREDEPGNGFVPLRDVPGTTGEIDRRILVEVRSLTEEAQETSNADGAVAAPPSNDVVGERNPDEAIEFYPDGTADAREILLQDRDGFRLALRINPVTARVHVVELDRK